jgi:hypothetical protein
LDSLQASLLDFFDLVHDEVQARLVAPQFGKRIRWPEPSPSLPKIDLKFRMPASNAHSDPHDGPASLDRFVPPPLDQLKQHLRVRLETSTGGPRSVEQSQQRARSIAHVDNHNECAFLEERNEGPAQIVWLCHGASIGCCEHRRPYPPAGHSILEESGGFENPTIRCIIPSCRHQLSPIAQGVGRQARAKLPALYGEWCSRVTPTIISRMPPNCTRLKVSANRKWPRPATKT